jgi:hypothetical protein
MAVQFEHASSKHIGQTCFYIWKACPQNYSW